MVQSDEVLISKDDFENVRFVTCVDIQSKDEYDDNNNAVADKYKQRNYDLDEKHASDTENNQNAIESTYFADTIKMETENKRHRRPVMNIFQHCLPCFSKRGNSVIQ